MRFFRDMKKYYHYARYAARAALRAEVAGSYLNWLWWVFNPFCMMLIYTFVFGYVFKIKEPYFPVFIFLGLTLNDFWNRTVKDSVSIVKKNKGTISKVYLPKYILVETKMFVNFVKMLIAMAIVVVMMIVWQVPVSYRVLYIVPIFIVLALFTFGLSCIILHFGVFVEDMSNIVNIILRFVFYATGIFYSIESRVDNPQLQHVLLHYNPMAFFLSSGRRVLIYNTDPEWIWLIIWTVGSLILCWIGVKLIYRYENSYAKIV